MARALRIQYPGAVYHVTCRGNERKDIFTHDGDRQKLLQILAYSLKIYGVELCSYVLMNNHFHLLTETPLGNLSEFMRHFNITYTVYYNRQHERVGHLYQGRYKSILVDKDSYLTALSRYIHLNPVRIKSMSKATVDEKATLLERYPWSSLPGFLSNSRKVSFVDYSTVLDEYGGDNDIGRKAYEKALYAELAAGAEIKSKILGQSVIGSDEFVKRIRTKLIGKGNSREVPAIKQICRYQSPDVILGVIRDETGMNLNHLRKTKGVYRQIAMDILYRLGGMKGPEIAGLFGVGYSSVSQERRRLNERLQGDEEIQILLSRLEGLCQH